MVTNIETGNWVRGETRGLLRIEGLALFVAATVAYFWLGHPTWLFFVLLLAPDLSALGYLGGPGVGARVYNAAHLTAGPLLLGGIGLIAGAPTAVAIALIWLAHIGIDRAAGYGLKNPEGFQSTHLGPIGRGHAA